MTSSSRQKSRTTDEEASAAPRAERSAARNDEATPAPLPAAPPHEARPRWYQRDRLPWPAAALTIGVLSLALWALIGFAIHYALVG